MTVEPQNYVFSIAEVSEEYLEVFRRLGAKRVEAVDVSVRADAQKPESIEAVKKATGLFFTGGDQLHITSLMSGPELQQAVMDAHASGAIIAGTSVDAAMTGNSMILSGNRTEIFYLQSIGQFELTFVQIDCTFDFNQFRQSHNSCYLFV